MDEITKIWPEWRTVELLGQGAFGSVYKVVKEDFGQNYYAAVKVINYPQDESERRELLSAGMDAQSIRNYFEENLQGMIGEIKVMESLKTAGNIVSIEDYKLVEKTEAFGWKLYIRMELLTSLDSLMITKGGFSEDETVKLGMDICSALECCEQSHTIHRDIKSANIFVNKYGDFKLGDFGISKQMESTMSVKSQKGTLMYMAPEIYRGESYDNTVDIYALGITMYRFLNNNRFPYMPPVPQNIRPGDADKAMSDRISGMPMPDPTNCDTELARIVKKACAFRPEERYLHASDMKKDLEKWKVVKMYGDMEETTFRSQAYQKKGPGDLCHGENMPKQEAPKWEAQSQEQPTWGQTKNEQIERNESASQNYHGFGDSMYEETYAAFQRKMEETKAEPRYEELKQEVPKQEGPVPIDGNDIYVDKNLPEHSDRDEFEVEINGKRIVIKRPDSLKDGMQIRLRGLGEKGMYGGKNGDLCVRIHIEQQSSGDIFGELFGCQAYDENVRGTFFSSGTPLGQGNEGQIFDDSHSHMIHVDPQMKDTIKEITIKPRQIVEKIQTPFGVAQNVKNVNSIIAPDGFRGCPMLEKVHISEGINLICDRAFADCKNLQTLYIPDSVKKIGENIVDKPEKKRFGFLNPAKTSKTLVVECHIGSYAESYCKFRKIPYKLV